MTKGLLIKDHSDEERFYLLDPETGNYAPQEVAQHDQGAISGFACRMRTGLVSPKVVFAALYATDGSALHFRIGDRVFDATSPTIHLERRWLAPFVRTFAISEGGKVSLKLVYWVFLQVGLGAWPAYTDFLGYVAERVRTRPSAIKLAYSWKALSEGRDVKTREFGQELEAHLKKAGLA